MDKVRETEGLDVEAYDTVEGIDEAIKSLRERRKAVKAEATKAEREAAKAEKARVLEEAKATLEAAGLDEGDTIRATLKGEEVIGSFVKATEARFIILVDGDKKTLPFDKFIGLVEADTADTVTDEVVADDAGDVDEEMVI